MIEIVAYRDSWPNEYREIAARLRDAAGKDILAIHHIGSTSVPGLVAKDIIDVQITVADIATAARLPLPAAGFALSPYTTDHTPPGMTLAPEQLEKRFFKFELRRANVHVRVAGRFNQRYPLLCRDYLRTHGGAANAYGTIKQQLARLHPDDIEAYYDVKDPVFDLLMAGAEDWARYTGWRQPPSDDSAIG